MNRKLKISIFIITTLVLGVVIFGKKQTQEVINSEKNVDTKVEQPEVSELIESSKVVVNKPTINNEESKNVDLVIEMKDLPMLNDINTLTEEDLHHTPAFVVEGGMLVGRLIADADKNPRKREETLKFLKSCAENSEVVPAIRALCWNKTLRQIPEWNVFLPVMDANVPQNIKDLAAKLP